MSVVRLTLASLVVVTGLAARASAQGLPPDEPKLSISGYVQPQFEIRTSHGTTRDQARLRRAVVTLDVQLMPNWDAELQADFGPLTSDSDRITVKNALLAYSGWEETHGIVLTIGNQKIPFSRSVMGSSSRRGLIERPFTGDRAYGSPGRAISVRADGWHRQKTLFWSAAIADTRFGPEPDELRVDGVAELGDKGHEGHLAGGRIEFHPLGEVPHVQGNFGGGAFRVTIGAGAYAWRSDGDCGADGRDPDASRISGLELSGALRGRGLSIDAEFEQVSAHARRPVPGGGLYALGDAHLRKGSLEAGYMLLPDRFEVLASIDALDARTFTRIWHRLAAGANWYVKRHDLKFSLMHRESFNDDGQRHARSRAAYLQAHFGF